MFTVWNRTRRWPARIQPGTPIQLQFIKPDGQRLGVSGVVWRVDPDGVAILFLGSVPEGIENALRERRPA